VPGLPRKQCAPRKGYGVRDLFLPPSPCSGGFPVTGTRCRSSRVRFPARSPFSLLPPLLALVVSRHRFSNPTVSGSIPVEESVLILSPRPGGFPGIGLRSRLSQVRFLARRQRFTFVLADPRHEFPKLVGRVRLPTKVQVSSPIDLSLHAKSDDALVGASESWLRVRVPYDVHTKTKCSAHSGDSKTLIRSYP